MDYYGQGPVARRRPNIISKMQSNRVQKIESPEIFWQPLYDRVNIATTIPSQVSFYSIAKGGTATLIVGTATASKTKTLRDTNMDTPNIEQSKLREYWGVSIAYVHATQASATNPVDRAMIRSSGNFRFRVIDKDIISLPLIMLPEMNPYEAIATTANATTINGDNGGGGASVSMYPFQTKVTVEPGQSFTVTFDFDTAATVTLSNTLDIYLILHGRMVRPS
jgi:hypothetical protein